jgi:chemotaxis methyl-accepting protein methylase
VQLTWCCRRISSQVSLKDLQGIPRILHATVDEGKNFKPSNIDEIPSIVQLLKQTTNVDFTHYKPTTIHRRIIRRMFLHKMTSLKDYHRYLKKNSQEVNILYNDLLIHVTCFFRNPDANEYIKKKLLPRIIRARHERTIRIWVPACSSGEEAYSLAMIVSEVLGDSISKTSVQILATDLSHSAIAKSEAGYVFKAKSRKRI